MDARDAVSRPPEVGSTTSCSHSDDETGGRGSSSNTSCNDVLFSGAAHELRRANLKAVMDNLPSSPKQLLQRMEQQQQEIRQIREENARLKSREVEVTALTVKLQHQISSTQSQVDRIKSQVQLQLSNPITEEEYHRLDELAEEKRDLLDTIKLGIYRQLGSMRSSYQAATRRAAELSTSVAQLSQETKELRVTVAELEARGGSLQDNASKKDRLADTQKAKIAALEADLSALESKLKHSYLDQEQYLSAKLTAQVKTDEVARLSVRLGESEMDVQRYRANAECSEQKLDILKSEYYELKLKYGQRVMELEAALKASDEKIKTLGDLEMESELFISNLAAHGNGEMAFATDGTCSGAGNAYESWMALPRSRKMAHSLVVTKRCLHLENKVTSLEQDLAFRDTQLSRLQVALDGARQALNNINSPYSLVEKAMSELHTENDSLKQRIKILHEEKVELQGRVQQYNENISILTQHRRELIRIKKLLRKLGICEGYVVREEEEEMLKGKIGPTRRRRKSFEDASGSASTPTEKPSTPTVATGSQHTERGGDDTPSHLGMQGIIEITS